MRKFLLSVLALVGTLLITQIDVSAQNIEVQVQVNSSMMTSTGGCNACGNTTPSRYTRLRYVFGSTTGEAGFNAASVGCGTYSSAGGPVGNPLTSSSQAYGTTGTIQLYADDTRGCEIATVPWSTANGGTITFNPTGIAPGASYSGEQTSTATGGTTTTTGTKWQWRWRYTSAGSPGTLTVSGGNNYCSSSIPGTISINGSTINNVGIQYEWRYSFDGFASVIGTGEDYSGPFPSGGGTYRRIAKWQNNYLAAPTYVTAQVDAVITVHTPPSGSVASPVNACSGSTVNTTINSWNPGTGTPTIQVRDPSSTLVYSSTSTSISFAAPAVLGAPSDVVSYSVTAVPPGGSYCTTPVSLGTLVVNYYESSKAPDSISVSPGSTICEGSNVTLTARGARLGYGGARYEWSTDPSFGSFLYTSTTDSTYTTGALTSGITYYVRVGNGSTPGGVCPSSTGSVSKVISIIDSTTPPSSVSQSSTYYCQGDPSPVTLTQVGGSLGTGANWQWSTDPTFTTVLTGQTGSSLNVLPGTGDFPAATTTYYVRGENTNSPCSPTSASASATVEYQSTSVVADSISSSTNGVCAGTSIDLTIHGGSLGTGAKWYWYDGACGGTPIDSGSTITVVPSTSTTYYARAEGACNTTACVSKYVFIFEPAVDPDSITYNRILCYDISTEVTLTRSGGTLGTGMEWYWFSDPSLDNSYLLGNGSTLNVDPLTYQDVYLAALSNGSYGSIPAPCPDTTTVVHADLTDMVLEVTPTMNSLASDVSTVCDTATITLTADGTADAYDVYVNTITSPNTFYKLYEEDPSSNPSATVLDSNLTGSFSQFIDTTTTYYVWIVNSCGESNVESTTVTVNYSSVAPDALSSTADSICNGDATDVTLTANNGTLGTGAEYEWSTDNFTTSISGETDSVITVSPTATTTYSVRIINTTAPCTDVSGTVQSFTLTVTEPSTAPTVITSDHDSICNGDATNVTLEADGTLGTDAVYEWSTDNFGTTISGENTYQLIVSPTATTTYYARIVGPAPCADVSATVVSKLVTVMEPSTAPTTLTIPNDSICNGSSITLEADGTLGTDAVYEWSTDNFGTTISGENAYQLTVSPTATTTYSVRITGPAPCADVSATVVSQQITVVEPSVEPTSVSSSTATPCYGQTVTFTQVGGSLGDALSVYEWSDDAGFSNILQSSTVDTFDIVASSPTTYYVRVVDPICGASAGLAIVIPWVQAATSVYGTGLCTTSVVATVCTGLDDNDWHYFVDEDSLVVAAINTNGQDLGEIEFGATLGANGPYISTSALSCTMGEYYAPRSYYFTSDNKATSAVSIRLFLTASEYAAHKATSDAQDAFYKNCFATTSSASDLQVSAFSVYDAGADGQGITSLSFSATGGPGGTHQYEFDLLPNYGGLRVATNGRLDPNTQTNLFIHNSGGRSSILPVELTTFTATKVDGGVSLDWSTASELNNDRFEVTRSTDGVNFVKIGEVKGAGNSNTPKNYNLIDNDVTSGVYYYQLRQVDFDGTPTLSKIVSVELSDEAAKFNVGNFFPNPAQHLSSVIINSPTNSDVVFTLYSIDGKQTLNKVYQLAKGENRLDIELSNIPVGSYIGIFQTNGQVINRKLIVQE